MEQTILLLVKVRRHRSVSVAYQDESGTAHRWEGLGQAEAELLQHEIDHLDGIVFIDHLSAWRRRLLWWRLRRLAAR